MTKEAQQAFLELKEKFALAPILIAFDLEKEIIVEIDVSNYTLGGVVS